MSDLIIKISADIKGLKTAFEDAKSESAGLEEGLKTVAEVSGVAFAALGAQVGVALAAYKEHEDASLQLNQALQNQGLYTQDLVNKYGQYAQAVAKTTGYDKAQITQSQAVAQSLLGQVPITQKMTQAIADLAAAQGVDLPSAARMFAESIAKSGGMLSRLGLQVSSTDTQQEKLAKTLEFVETRFGGMAEATNQGLGSMRGLASAVKDAEAELGKQFAPAAEAAIKALTDFIQPAQQSSEETEKFKAALIVAGLAISGVGVAIPILSQGFLTIRAALIAMDAQLSITQALLAGLGIGLLSIAITELALHWKQATAVIMSTVHDMTATVSAAFAGLKEVIQGALHLDSNQIKQGVEDIGNAFKKMGSDAKDAWTEAGKASEESVQVQDQAKKELADKEAKRLRDSEAQQAASDKVKAQLATLEAQNASKQLIDLKKQELSTLDAFNKASDDKEITALQKKLSDIRKLESEAEKEDAEQKSIYAKQSADTDAEFARRGIEVKAKLNDDEKNNIIKTAETEQTAQNKVYTDELKAEIKANNTFLEEKRKYGTAYAAINRAIHSDEVQGFSNATNDLVALQQSQNSTLKTIGKEAATAQIVIKTATAAMNVYEGFSSIPFIGQALGLAAAAAVIAYGAEQIQAVQGAAQGGMVAGVGSGDTVPFMLEPGELIAPKQNFNEVVDSVAQSRGYIPPGGEAGSAGYAEVMLTLKGDLMDFIEAKLVQRKYLNISLQGSK